jgi:hypothetical protein
MVGSASDADSDDRPLVIVTAEVATRTSSVMVFQAPL